MGTHRAHIVHIDGVHPAELRLHREDIPRTRRLPQQEPTVPGAASHGDGQQRLRTRGAQRSLDSQAGVGQNSMHKFRSEHQEFQY